MSSSNLGSVNEILEKTIAQSIESFRSIQGNHTNWVFLWCENVFIALFQLIATATATAATTEVCSSSTEQLHVVSDACWHTKATNWTRKRGQHCWLETNILLVIVIAKDTKFKNCELICLVPIGINSIPFICHSSSGKSRSYYSVYFFIYQILPSIYTVLFKVSDIRWQAIKNATICSQIFESAKSWGAHSTERNPPLGAKLSCNLVKETLSFSNIAFSNLCSSYLWRICPSSRTTGKQT